MSGSSRNNGFGFIVAGTKLQKNAKLKGETMSDALIKVLEHAGQPNILVVGDLVLDRYVWGEAQRISPEGPIPVFSTTSEEERPGGAGNVVAALAALGAKVSLCGGMPAEVRDTESQTALFSTVSPLSTSSPTVIISILMLSL